MPLSIRLYNTKTRQIEQFRPLKAPHVSLYCCGPTVYNFQHIGNLRTYLFEDTLVRTLRYAGYQVKHAMNITDVGHLVSDADIGEDKMLVAARREGKRSHEIAEHYTKIFFDDCAKLNIVRPDIVCKATDHIPQMIELIRRLERNGATYVAGGNVYFDVAKFPAYGELARLNLDELRAGARIDIDPNKRGPLDFVLWFTKSKFENQELQWESPWGRGYPGWHIECSAMSIHHLGESFDIHCGGIDHIPVHHTNEVAQSEAAIGHQWVPHWMHGEFLLMNAEKMSKSKGTFFTLSTLTEHGLDPLAYRFFIISSSYRTQLNFTWENVENAGRSLAKLRTQVLQLKASAAPATTLSPQAKTHQSEFEGAICDDLNTPKAIASVWAAINNTSLPAAERLALLYQFDQVLGLGMAHWAEEQVAIPLSVQTLVDERQRARQNKNFAESDRLRDEILKLGFVVKDTPQGIVVKRK